MDNYISTAFKLQVMHYVVLVPTIILYYDHILTFAREVEWIWKRKLTLPTSLFLILRYSATIWKVMFLSLLLNPSFYRHPKLSCAFMLKVPMAYFVIHTAIIETILMLRTYALYRCSRVVLVVLSGYILSQFIATIVLTSNVRSDAASGSMPMDSETMVYPMASVKVPDCSISYHNNTITLFWWFSIGFDTLVFILTFIKLNYLRKKISPDKFPLLKVITRDGLIFYVVICCFNLLNLWSYFFLTPELKVASINFSFGFSTVIVTRLVLNIQDVSRQTIGRLSTGYNVNQDGETSSQWDTDDDGGVLTTVPSVFIIHAGTGTGTGTGTGADTSSRTFKRSVWNSIEDLH